MPRPKDPNSPQHNIDQAHWGALPKEMLPQGIQENDMLLWDKSAVDWKFVRIMGATGLDVSYDAANGILEIALTDSRVYVNFTSDAALVITVPQTFTANAVLA